MEQAAFEDQPQTFSCGEISSALGATLYRNVSCLVVCGEEGQGTGRPYTWRVFGHRLQASLRISYSITLWDVSWMIPQMSLTGLVWLRRRVLCDGRQ
jgi:hypothetical protein